MSGLTNPASENNNKKHVLPTHSPSNVPLQSGQIREEEEKEEEEEVEEEEVEEEEEEEVEEEEEEEEAKVQKNKPLLSGTRPSGYSTKPPQ